MHLLSEDASCESRECLMEGDSDTVEKYSLFRTGDSEWVLDDLEIIQIWSVERIVLLVKTFLEAS